MSATSQITVDFRKVQWCAYFYINQEGLQKRCKPVRPTVRGLEIGDDVALAHPDYPQETMLERAKRLGILDVWTPKCVLHISANRCLCFSGKKAVTIHLAYRKYIYDKARNNNAS
jgi:hypothetical protein